MRPSRQVIHGRQCKLYTSVMGLLFGNAQNLVRFSDEAIKGAKVLNFPRDEAMEILSA
jgi:hypothetical protein